MKNYAVKTWTKNVILSIVLRLIRDVTWPCIVHACLLAESYETIYFVLPQCIYFSLNRYIERYIYFSFSECFSLSLYLYIFLSLPLSLCYNLQLGHVKLNAFRQGWPSSRPHTAVYVVSCGSYVIARSPTELHAQQYMTWKFCHCHVGVWYLQ